METTPKITIEELAVKLNGKMWTKGDLKRIYLDRGYNTKKMSTKTYVFEKDGEFIVVCNIDCPSQAYQWIKSQEQEVIDGVYENIEAALVTDYYLVINNDTALFVDSCGSDTRMNDLGSSSIYFSKEKAERFIEKELFGNYSVQLISREAFDRQVDELDAIEKANYVAPVVVEKVISRPVAKPLTETEQNLTFAPGTKVSHARFGKGEIIAIVDADPAFRKLSILFEDGTTKELLERFANLQKVD